MDKVAHYVDTFKDGSVDKNAAELAVKLRDERLTKAIYKRNLKRFEIDWSGIDGLSLETHSKYFNGKKLFALNEFTPSQQEIFRFCNGIL